MAWVRDAGLSMLLFAGGCLWDTENPACADAIVQTVAEDDAPDAYASARSAHDERMLSDAIDPAQENTAITLEVASLDTVEWVERSPACSDRVGHRATAQLEVSSDDGNISVRVPGWVSLPTEGVVALGLTAGRIALDDTTVVPEIDKPEGAVVAGIEIEIDDDTDTVTLFRVDMAPSCGTLEGCDAVERRAIASWTQPALEFDLWFDRVGP